MYQSQALIHSCIYFSCKLKLNWTQPSPPEQVFAMHVLEIYSFRLKSPKVKWCLTNNTLANLIFLQHREWRLSFFYLSKLGGSYECRKKFTFSDLKFAMQECVELSAAHRLYRFQLFFFHFSPPFPLLSWASDMFYLALGTNRHSPCTH